MGTTSSASIWLVLLLAAALANLPFGNERLFAFGPRQAPKSVAWRLLELAVYAALVVIVGRWLEGRGGQISSQGWPFYAVLACVFLTLAFPGFVWRYLRRRKAAA
ncbi:MAG TPA: DUF2818 family protein [Burkholderiaceae bacterium]|nr:DUF2818 family protein [Burkholderiaceae bacterium]HMX10897.1 DUF2818 family protein [Burkholderiaceae bacterium]HNB44646.1 DUF2818 family protein [Burkholderiaceae bacterium]HNG79445.1 DUF2818 family protein [Burkholderiaceae bacterium]